MRRLILILGDQLSLDIAALRQGERRRDVVLMAEVQEEATYVRHHKKKIAFVFSAMRHFAEELAEDGWAVDYVALDDPENRGSITTEIERAVARRECEGVVVTEPGEWRLLEAIRDLGKRQDLNLQLVPDDRFLCAKADFIDWAAERKQLRMEHFYREMRRKMGLLMDGNKPEGGRWNFDSENRKTPPKGLNTSGPKRFAPDAITKKAIELVDARFENHFGDLEPFWFAVNRRQAVIALDHFIETGLASFGDYQDAMILDDRFLFHAVISLYLNVGLLQPMEVCERVERAYRAGEVPLNAAEGFIRQIIGWREYVRGIYWTQMPNYVRKNFLEHGEPLPNFYWTGETDMACLRTCITQTREEAYAHHIQRLMVTGNFAMLAGVDPREVHEWYLAVYADAYEWVELPNTLGMSQFADGGLLGSKPYAASGNYINRMSDYCASCRYDVKVKNGIDACPFNYLYWNFLDRHRDKLGENPRLRQIYRTWEKMDPGRKHAVRGDADKFFEGLKKSGRD